MEIYNKLQTAREIIKMSDLKKAGRNEYSKYDYYTPEQVEQLVSSACETAKLLPIFNLDKNEFGLFGTLTLINLLNTEEKIVFKQVTDIPSITATNIAQQIGGAVTYTKRYMLMTVFNIVDNNLDFDQHKPKAKPKTVTKWLTDGQFSEVKKLDKELIKQCLNKYNGKEKNGTTYLMKKDFRIELEKLVNE